MWLILPLKKTHKPTNNPKVLKNKLHLYSLMLRLIAPTSLSKIP